MEYIQRVDNCLMGNVYKEILYLLPGLQHWVLYCFVFLIFIFVVLHSELTAIYKCSK